MRRVGDTPSITFQALKKEGLADGYAEIDNNGGFDDPKPISEISGSNPLAGSSYDLAERGGTGLRSEPGADGNGGEIAPQGKIVATDAVATRSEPTQAGDQTLIDGVAPITARDRLQAKADAPLRARSRRSDTEIGGMFDPNDPSRFALFDLVPTGRSVDEEGSKIAPVMTRAELAAELDAEDEALAVLDICMRGVTR